MLDRYLDSLTTYAETVVSSEVDDDGLVTLSTSPNSPVLPPPDPVRHHDEEGLVITWLISDRRISPTGARPDCNTTSRLNYSTITL